MASIQSDTKLFVGGLSWNTTAEKLESYFSNFGQVLEAFVSFDRVTGRPRGFGFVVFEDPAVAERVASQQHTIDRREVEAKKAVPKNENIGVRSHDGASQSPQRTKKIFVGGLAPSVDELAFQQYFEQFGPVEDAVVMYDHDSKRPRGFGFVTFVSEDAVEQVLMAGPRQTLHDKQIEIKRAVPRDQMPQPRGMVMMRPPAYGPYGSYSGGRAMPTYGGYGQASSYPLQGQYPQSGYGGHAYRSGASGSMQANLGVHLNSSHMGGGTMSGGMSGGSGGGMPMGGLAGGLNSGAEIGGYAGAGMGGGMPAPLGMSGMGLGSMAAPLGGMGGSTGGTGNYGLASVGSAGTFHMGALQGALPGGGRGSGDPAQPSSIPGSLGSRGPGLDGGRYNGAQGLESYPLPSVEGYSIGGDGIYGSVGAAVTGTGALEQYQGGGGGESYGLAGGALAAAGPGGDHDNGYSASGSSPSLATYNAVSSAFAAAAQHAVAQGGASPRAFVAQSPTAFNAPSLAMNGLGIASSSSLGANQPPASTAFSPSSFTESPVAWS